MRVGVLLLVLSCCLVLTSHAARAEDPMLVYFGTYNGPKSQGIYVSRLNPETGELSKPELAAEARGASFLAIHPNKKYLYAVSEVSDAGGKKSGGIAAYSIDRKTGKLAPLNNQPSGGGGPCFVSIDPTGKVVLVANYGSGSVASLPVKEDGTLGEPASAIQHEGSGPDPKRQTGPHAHSFYFDPTNTFALACDLGLDKVLVYRVDHATAKLTPNDPPHAATPPGGGPRHLAFHPGGRYAYVINEMGDTITAFAWDSARGALTELHTVPTLPSDYGAAERNTTAEVVVHPTGQFLYGSNRGHDSIAAFAIDQQTGRLTPAGHTSTQGKTPRNFAIEPGGRFLLAANQNSDNVVVFKIDPMSGALSPTGTQVEVGGPVCVRFLPAE